ncbi:hypothetical protein A3860_18525 [Niastella vici]|uniref:Uncharacterized protein n=1 Tax=Niastella vici TaxID=1703345 RepID=A0A1V9G287_9BACT|nr:hypothetical protein A3860_18525 [Niastella vici]
MNLVIKPECNDTWFPVPKVLVERDMPMISINSLALYTILSCYQDSNGRVTKPLMELKHISGLRSLTVIRTIEYLKSRKLIKDILLDSKTRVLELAIKPQLKKRKKFRV